MSTAHFVVIHNHRIMRDIQEDEGALPSESSTGKLGGGALLKMSTEWTNVTISLDNNKSCGRRTNNIGHSPKRHTASKCAPPLGLTVQMMYAWISPSTQI